MTTDPADNDSTKKDLTSLLELSELEIAKNQPEGPIPTSEKTESVVDIPVASEPDFGSFEPQMNAPSDFDTTPEQAADTLVPINAPPAGLAQAKQSPEPTTRKNDLNEVKKFGDKLAIGAARMEATPAFSVLAVNKNGKFDERTIKTITDILGNDDYGIRFEEIAIQLEAGKLLLPQISEFAAVTLAQKLRDVVDEVQIDLASEIFASSAAGLASSDDSFLIDSAHRDQRHEEIRNIDSEPASEQDLFSTTLAEAPQFQVTRILSAVTASVVVSADVAENTSTRAFEEATDRVARELVSRAFKLGAHGVLGVSFALRPTGHAYRLLGTGTAVRGRLRK